METQGHLTLSLIPETLDFRSEEEIATFGAFVLEANGRRLTEGVGVDENELRPGPYVSGYHVAQRLTWNWWRLRWDLSEERRDDAAERFKVSPLTIRTLLVNNGRIERDTITDALDRI